MSIKAKNISVRIGKKLLLEDVSFEAKTGEIIAILGANGAGKSTLLKTLCGEIKPFEGDILFGEKGLDKWKVEDISKVRAVLPQSFEMNFPFKVNEVTLLGRTPHISFSETKRDFEIVQKALEKVEALKLTDRFYPTRWRSPRRHQRCRRED